MSANGWRAGARIQARQSQSRDRCERRKSCFHSFTRTLPCLRCSRHCTKHSGYKEEWNEVFLNPCSLSFSEIYESLSCFKEIKNKKDTYTPSNTYEEVSFSFHCQILSLATNKCWLHYLTATSISNYFQSRFCLLHSLKILFQNPLLALLYCQIQWPLNCFQST